MSHVFICPKCKKEFDSKDKRCNAEFYDDDEDENGNHRWVVSLDCPFCNYSYYDEVWDEDFGNK